MKFPYAPAPESPKRKKRFLTLTKENLKPLDDEYNNAKKMSKIDADWSFAVAGSVKQIIASNEIESDSVSEENGEDIKKKKIVHMIKPLTSKADAQLEIIRDKVSKKVSSFRAPQKIIRGVVDPDYIKLKKHN